MLQRNEALTIYRASAGSGKTFRLAIEYIKLVISDPSCYRNILAVTFTNKATEEMKLRILSHLYGIAHQFSDSKEYMKVVVEELNITEEYAVRQAERALSNLIHNYHYFRVETIDTFFQSVLRNLAHELDLPTNLRIELNDYLIEEHAVDELIESLDKKNKILFWILDYIKENISDDKNWNVFNQVKKFGTNIFKDVYKQNSNELQKTLEQRNFFDKYTGKIRNLKYDAKQQLESYANAFNELLKSNGLSISELSNGSSGASSYFIKLQNGLYDEGDLLKQRVLKAMDDPSSWFKKADNLNENSSLNDIANKLTRLLIDTEKRRPLLVKVYKSSDITLKNLNQLRLLSSIERKVRELNEEMNSFLLSDTQILLNALIRDNDSPFIFEKIGTQLKHIMIDEFQDTSMTQWKNFKVLLKECMSHENSSNLIVGDVKQSIYRWRSGDWRLLNNLEVEFPHAVEQLQTKTLKTNFRSERNIIMFNNVFFETASKIEYDEQKKTNAVGAEQLAKAYNNQEVIQEIPDWKLEKGSVQIDLIPHENYQEIMLKLVQDAIQELIDEGAKENDIAIIVRSNKTIKEIADYFMQNSPTIKMVSDEAFCLDSSLAVNMIIGALRFLINQDDSLLLANISKAYQKQILHNIEEDNELIIRGINYIDLLPAGFRDHLEELTLLPLSELVEKICTIFQLSKFSDQSAYLLKFFDVMENYLQDKPADIESFLTDWDDNLHQKAIQNNELDGIRLMTIHKSKGLEFDHVIIPYCDWQLEKGGTIWCQPQTEPFNELPIVPVYYNEKQMRGSIYENDFMDEHLQNTVDNLNLLYVAFTRSRKNLFVMGQRGKKGIRSYLIEQTLEKMSNSLLGSTINGDFQNLNEAIHFSFGVPCIDNNTKLSQSENLLITPSIPLKIEIESYENQVEFRQSTQSREFMGEEENTENSSYVQAGKVLHYILSTIKTTEDIDNAMKELEFEGILDRDELNKNKLMNMLKKRLADPKVASWYSPKWELFNECSILHIDHSTNNVLQHRPDRVMRNNNEIIVVDYKFGAPRLEYQQQVRKYMQLLQEMNYKNVKGYLWFVYSNQIEEVLLESTCV